MVLVVVLIPSLLAFLVGMGFSFDEGYRTSGIIALIQCICVVASLVIGLKKNSSGVKVALMSVMLIAAFVMVVPFFSCMSDDDIRNASTRRKEERLEDYVRVDTNWPTNGIGSVTPKPDLGEADIWQNTEEELSLFAADISEDFYKDYKQQCIDGGFTESVNTYQNSYEAYTKEGYHLTVFLTEKSEFHLNVKAPIKMEHYLWPESGVGSLIPEPDQEYGKINEDRNRSFRADIYGVSAEDFEKYVEACREAGFTKNALQRSNVFTAEDKDGNMVDLFLYSDFYQTLSITVKQKD